MPAFISIRAVKQVHHRGDDRHDEADADLLQRLRVQQPFDRGDADGDCRNENQETLEAAGEVLRLAVAVGVWLSSGGCAATVSMASAISAPAG